MIQAGFTSRQVFVDTSAFFAIANQRDSDHENTTAILQHLLHERSQLITTNFILAELHALLLTRINRSVALSTLQEIYGSRTTTMVRVSEADETEARAVIEQYDDKDFSLTDATCFAIMRRLGIPRAFTLDRDFSQYGIEVIPTD